MVQHAKRVGDLQVAGRKGRQLGRLTEALGVEYQLQIMAFQVSGEPVINRRESLIAIHGISPAVSTPGGARCWAAGLPRCGDPAQAWANRAGAGSSRRCASASANS